MNRNESREFHKIFAEISREPKASNRTVRLPESLDAMFQRLCDASMRDPDDLFRAVILLFFLDGFEVANERLNLGVWELKAETLAKYREATDAIVREAKQNAGETQRGKARGRRPA